MRRREVIGWFTLTLILTLSLTLPGAAAELHGAQMGGARLEAGPTRIDWLPQADYEQWVLTVAGPGDLYIRREFKGGKAPFLSLFDAKGDRLPDGTYTWELRGIPKAGALPREELLQSGHFFVREGSFVAVPMDTAARPPKAPHPNITAKNFVETGTLVVQNNACIGNQCGTSDASFSALKLKSTLPNILFDDVDVPCESPPCTSTAHDWALVINPSDVAQFSIKDVDGSLIPFSVAAGAPDNSLYVRSNGNVGLGTSTPAVRLDVRVNSSGEAAQRLQNSNATGYSATEYLDNAGNVALFFGLDNAASNTRINSLNNFPLVIFTNSTERMRITSAGSVGIGTSSPSSRLDIVANAPNADVVRIRNTDTTGFPGIDYLDNTGVTGLYFGLDNAANTTRLNSVNDKPIVILTNSTERMRVTSAGSVGIGTSSPSSKLHVNGGDIRVSGGSFIDDGVTLNAPDYVFEPNYKLMPLESLKEFLAQEKHLPNVPNAREVKEQGLNLSQFQMRLLEKIEELTLYTLSQQEQIGSLHKENSELRKRLEALEARQQP